MSPILHISDSNRPRHLGNLEGLEMTHQYFTTTIAVDQAPDEAYSAILHVADWWTASNEGKLTRSPTNSSTVTGKNTTARSGLRS